MLLNTFGCYEYFGEEAQSEKSSRYLGSARARADQERFKAVSIQTADSTSTPR